MIVRNDPQGQLVKQLNSFYYLDAAEKNIIADVDL